jgi:hypothetical protein
MLSLIKDKKNIIKQLTFNKPLEHYGLSNNWEVVHEDMARQFAKTPWNYLTVIVETEPLAEKLWDDSRHAHISYTTLCSELEERAREQAEGHFFTESQIENIFKKHQFPKDRYNWEDEEEEYDKETPIETELKDAIFDAQVKMLYPRIIEEFKEECRYEYDEQLDEEIKLAPRAFAKKWKKQQLEIFLPRVHKHMQRAFPNTPEPFGHFASVAQYFFIEKEDQVEWVFGAGSGSQTRYAHGLMGHVFATLTKKYNKTIPTYFFKNTKNNDFKYIQKWETFKVDRRDLTGNYPAYWETSESLFKDLLFHFPTSIGFCK